MQRFEQGFQPENIGMQDSEPASTSFGLSQKFSKEIASDLRDKTAQELKLAKDMPKTYTQLDPERKSSYEPLVEVTIKEVQKDTIGRIFRTENFKSKLLELDRMLANARKTKIENVRFNYKKAFDKILEESPLSVEEQQKYLSVEAMEAMNVDDYTTLLKRLSGNFITHVTRYGVREQGWFHNAGQGEVFDSFKDILKSKKLHSFFSNFLTDPNSVSYVIGSIRDVKNQTGLTGDSLVVKVLEIVDTTNDENMPADSSSVHGAVNYVASAYYGAEKGYDIYFYYPAEFIAHNYYHHHKGSQHDQTQWLDGHEKDWADKHNDLAIWNDGKGIPVDAGITCIPAHLKVDPITGSQYKIVDGKPIAKADGSGFEPAEHTITSKEYWQNFFRENPSLQPNKIVYGRFTTQPRFEATRAYSSLLNENIYKTTDDLPNQSNVETFETFKNQLAEYVRTLEDEGVI